MAIPNNANSINPSRYGRSFNVLSQYINIAPFFFMASAQTGVAGDVLQYNGTNEESVTLAASGIVRHQIAGILLQDVKDLDAGAVRGWRNLNNSVANLGDNVGVLQGPVPFLAETKRYTGSVTLFGRLQVAKAGQGQLEAFSATNTGDAIAVVEATVSSVPQSTEPAQLSSSSGNNFIRIKVYGI